MVGTDGDLIQLFGGLVSIFVLLIVHQTVQIYHLGNGKHFLEAVEHQRIVPFTLSLAATAGLSSPLRPHLSDTVISNLFLFIRRTGHRAQQHSFSPKGYRQRWSIAFRCMPLTQHHLVENNRINISGNPDQRHRIAK